MNQLHYYRPDWIKPDDRHLRVDLCVYGASSAGISAAYTAAQRGLSVVLLHPGQFIGGLTTGGLGWTDYGKKHVIGGLARSFYQRCGQPYGKEEEWYFEPHVAADVFQQWLSEARVQPLLAQYLDAVQIAGNRIESIRLLGGLQVSAKMFIDATYEGDLMAKAGVRYTVGRESNATYGETLNGIQIRHYHQFSHRVDPFIKPGDPNSGLLPFIENVDQNQRVGEGDQRVQAYCFRMCMTDDPALKIDWEKPAGYDPLHHELAVRWYAAEKDEFNQQVVAEGKVPRKFDIFPNRTPGGFCKTDTNNHGAVSSDFIGAGWAWANGDYATREKLFQAHVTYQKGFYWTIANDPRVPEMYRNAYRRWGLPKDEFTQTGHWPHTLYVREARRLVGDYVITEADCTGRRRAEDSIGMGSYNMDSHNCTRFVTWRDGQAWVLNDGDVQVPAVAYPISYRAILPPRGQCANLLIPVCFSASHIAYGSARMEPVFIGLGESAVLAAELAIRQQVALHDVPYAPLRSALDAAEQVTEAPA